MPTIRVCSIISTHSHKGVADVVFLHKTDIPDPSEDGDEPDIEDNADQEEEEVE